MKIVNTKYNYIILTILILLYIFYKGIFTFSKNDLTKSIIIVISRYNEDLKWILEYPFNKYKYIVYNKGINDNFEKKNVLEIINLPNVGKCDHTYLYHIINNYNNLSDIVVFVPGSCNVFYKKYKLTYLLNKINQYNSAIFISDFNCYNIKKCNYNFSLNHWKTRAVDNYKVNSEESLLLSDIRPFGKWYDNTFNNIIINNITLFGIFSISKDDILNKDIDYYKNLLIPLEKSSNPEIGHYYERSWEAIFYKMNHTKVIHNYINQTLSNIIYLIYSQI